MLPLLLWTGRQISFQKTLGPISFRENIANIWNQSQVVWYCYSKITDMIDIFKDCSFQGVKSMDLFFLTFNWLEPLPQFLAQHSKRSISFWSFKASKNGQLTCSVTVSQIPESWWKPPKLLHLYNANVPASVYRLLFDQRLFLYLLKSKLIVIKQTVRKHDESDGVCLFWMRNPANNNLPQKFSPLVFIEQQTLSFYRD